MCIYIKSVGNLPQAIVSDVQLDKALSNKLDGESKILVTKDS